MVKKQQLKIRDKQITIRRLISAVGSILAKKGFKGVGVNAVAREAGVDKVLIYRYFGGLPGLMAAFAKEGDFWPSALELAGGDLQAFSSLSMDEKLSLFTSTFIRAIRKRPITQAILAWEMIEPNDLTEELERVREQSISQFFQMFFIKEGGEALQGVISLMGAALQYLIVRSNHIDLYGGLDLKTQEGWDQIESVVNVVIKGVLKHN